MGTHKVVIYSLNSRVSHGHWVILDLWLFLQVRTCISILRIEVPGDDYEDNKYKSILQKKAHTTPEVNRNISNFMRLAKVRILKSLICASPAGKL